MRELKEPILVLVFLFLTFCAQAQNPGDEMYSRGVTHLMAKDFPEAEKDFSDALAAGLEDDQRKMTYVYRSFARDGQGNLHGALLDLDSAVAVDPNDLTSYFDRVKVLLKLQEFDLVVKDMEFVLSHEADNDQQATANYFLGRANYGLNDFREVIENMSVNLASFPRDIESLLFRASAKERIGDFAGSIEDYDRIVEINPDIKEVYANRGVLKIYQLTKGEDIKLSKKRSASACEDMIRAQSMGDNSVDELIETHCK